MTGLSVQFGLHSRWSIRFAGSRRFGPGFLGLLLPLPRRRCSGLRFHFLAGLTDARQTVLPPPQFIRQITAQLPLAVALVLLGIQDFGPAHQGVDLLLQFLLCSEHPLVAHGLVLGGIGLHLGAIQRHMTQAHHPCFLAEAQDLNKQALECIKVAAPKITDTAVVRLLVGRQHPKGQILVAGTLDLPGGEDADAVGVEQQQRQPLRGRRVYIRGSKPFSPRGSLL